MVGCQATVLLYFSIVVSILGKYAYVTLLWCQKWSGMAHDSIVLPEVSVENFEHAWKRFRLAETMERRKAVANFAGIVAGQSCGLYTWTLVKRKRSLWKA